MFSRFFSMLLSLLAPLLAPLAYAPQTDVILATFGDSSGTQRSWRKTDDPVMGGLSASSFEQSGGKAVFNGTCAVVPSLQAPGFCNVETQGGLFEKYPDTSSFLEGALYLKVRSNTASFAGFKVALESKHVKCPRPGFPGTPSWKAPFAVPQGAHFSLVKVPFSTFSCDWSGYTGGCDTKDPTGQQHVCCTSATPEVCPTKEVLGAITGLELWAEGAEGNFHLEVQSIGAGPI